MDKFLKRVSKDIGVPINITRIDYFKARIAKYEGYYNIEKSIQELNDMTQGLVGKDYDKLNKKEIKEVMSYMSKVERQVIQRISETKGIEKLRDKDHKEYTPMVENISKQDIYKEQNIGVDYIGVDIVKANYSILKKFSEDIVLGSETYEGMVGLFTPYEYLKNSKYIRQIIFGNNNPKRQQMLQKYYMSKEISNLLEKGIIKKEEIVTFTPDEFIINVDGKMGVDCLIEEIQSRNEIPLKIEQYTLKGIYETTDKGAKNIGYIKEYKDKEKQEIKSVSQDRMIYVIQKLKGQEITEEDTLFTSGGDLLKMLEPPKISIKTK